MLDPSSTRIKDAGIAICHMRGCSTSILQRPGMGLREWTWCGPGQKNMLTLSKRHFFVMGNYIEDARQDEKHVPDLLEPIIPSPGLVKEELRPILSKMIQIRS